MRRNDEIEMALRALVDVLEDVPRLPVGLVKEARAALSMPRQGYRRGLGRLVGNAHCNECRTHKPALTCFDNAEDGSSCGWMVCDDCLYKVLPLPAAVVDLARSCTAILDALEEMPGLNAESAAWMGASRDDARDALSRLVLPDEDEAD